MGVALIQQRKSGWFIAFMAALLAAAPAWAARDVVLVLDNSGSMQGNDPSRLAVSAVREFIKTQPADTRVGIVQFAESAEMIAPLTPVDEASSDVLMNSLARLTYRGRWTQTASAVERALYELRQEGRANADHAIVLMTDGLIDTGDARRDAELRTWLETNLAQQAQRQRVRIFGIAFTERADYQLLQLLAAATGAEYFRVLDPQDLSQSMQRIEAVLSTDSRPAAPAASAPAAMSAAAPESVEPETQAPPPGLDPSSAPVESSGVLSWLLPVSAALVLLGAGVVWRRRRASGSRRAAAGNPADPPGPRAVLVDLADPSGPRRYQVSHRPVVIGRKAGTDPGQDYVIVPDKTVGRWHATILRKGQSFTLRDENSVNGTFVNNERIQGEHPLRHGDIVRVHGHAFEFMIPELADSESTLMLPGR